MEATTIKAHASFSGGVHPEGNKELTSHKPAVPAAIPKRVVIPLSQHIGAPTKPLVVLGQEVKKGEKIGEAAGFVSAPVHASISGKVTAIGNFPHSLGMDVTSIVIEGDGKDDWISGLKETPDYQVLNPAELKKMVQDAGIVGMGGATFPTFVKLSPPKEKPIDVVILNGAECEPYLTSDHRLMLDRPREIIEGLKILMRILGVKKGYVGIEANKPDAIEAMKKAAAGSPDIQVWPIKVKYPQGAEKMLIKAIVNRTVPAGGLPMDIGVVVQNVGTADAIYTAVAKVDEELTAAGHARFRLVYLTLSGSVGLSNEEAALTFFQRFVNRLRQTKSVGIYSVDAGMHSDQLLQAMEHLMDGAVKFKQEGTKRFLSVIGLPEVQTRNWVEYTATNREVNLRAFALERIR